MAWATPPTFTGLATSAAFNILRDCLNAIGNSWGTYSPVVSASVTAPTMGASTVAGRFRSMGKTADVQIEITIGSGFSAGSGNWNFSLPSGMAPVANGATSNLGTATVRDVSVPTQRAYHVVYLSTTAVTLIKSDDGSLLSSVAPWAWATGDRISICIRGLEIT